MDELLNYLKLSLEDEVLSKSEKKDLKALLAENLIDQNQLNFLRSRMYELASEKVNATNYPFILEWIRATTSVLQLPVEPTADAYFSPGDACRNVIIRQIESAINQLNICVFTISDDHITSSLLAAHKKGVQIKVITDNDKSLDMGSDIEQIAKAGIAVRMDTSPNHMHHKFMVVDQRSLITGSYNWTVSAARYNHENILCTHEPKIIKTFSNQFDQLWKIMEKYE